MHGKVVLGIRSVGNIKKAERPTRYAKGGKQGNMMVKPCPCLTKNGRKKK